MQCLPHAPSQLLQERGHILLDVLDYLQNPDDGEEGDEDESFGHGGGYIGACKKLNLSINQFDIIHYERYDGSSVVYKFSKMPGIIIRNIFGLIKLRFAK